MQKLFPFFTRIVLMASIVGIIPSSRAQSFEMLHSFRGTNGANPYARLLQASDGDLYGTTFNGGTNSLGTLFKMTLSGLVTPLVHFANTNGRNPYAELVQGNDGSFYGTTYQGGTIGNGTAFKMTTQQGVTTLVSFTNNNGSFRWAD